MIEEACREDPRDPTWQEDHADALEAAWERRGLDPAGECPCGSGRRYGSCCRPAEQEAIERFLDSSAIDSLETALLDYTTRPELARFRNEARGMWFTGRPAEADSAEAEALMAWSWQLTLDDGSPDCILYRFAGDETVEPALRERARGWLEENHCGLWQVSDREAGPGMVLTDLLTGVRAYAAPGPGLPEEPAPWTVLFGRLVPVEGTWRPVPGLVELTPAEGDRLGNLAMQMSEAVAAELIGAGRTPHWTDAPLGVLTEHRAPASRPIADFLGKVVAAGTPHLLRTLREWRQTLPNLRNMEGHRTLLLRLEIEVDRIEALRSAMATHPDFDETDDGFTWLGPEMGPAQRKVALAQLRAHARKKGLELDEEDLRGPSRWTRGRLKLGGGVIVAEVNSFERRDALLALLGELGARPRVRHEARVDPAQDFAFASGGAPPPGGGMSDEALDAWLEAWLDEPVPALEDKTPREAADDEKGAVLLEALLRDFEHRSAKNLSLGINDFDVGRIREAFASGWAAPYATKGKARRSSGGGPGPGRRSRGGVNPAGGARLRGGGPARRPGPFG